MLYLNNADIRALGRNWQELSAAIASASQLVWDGDYAQPLKPYLRYGNPANRAIAMPAYLGGELHSAGIKWISSFPGNLRAGLPRAHSVTVLNDADTGVPQAVINSPIPSGLRTAAVTAALLGKLLALQPGQPLRIGILGFGPVGQLHYEMAWSLFGERIEQVYLLDPRGITAGSLPQALHPAQRERTRIARSWRELYEQSTICLTCTVADNRYITSPPRPGTWLLHISLRDYIADALRQVNHIIVDDWQEVCRENTDIELLHRTCGLQEHGTLPLAGVLCGDTLGDGKLRPHDTVLFCPMGMAVYDLAISALLARQAEARGIGQQLSS